MLPPKGAGPIVPQNFGDLVHVRTLYEKQQPNFYGDQTARGKIFYTIDHGC